MNQALIRTLTNESPDPASPGSGDKLLMLNVLAKTQGKGLSVAEDFTIFSQCNSGRAF